jgi:membrane protein DedA with SNARE-associated domain/membrane-associated phospholipid phosphatase
MFDNFAHGLAETFHAHPHWALTIAFSVAFVESIAVIGTIVPGSVTMTAIGVLVGTGVMPASLTFVVSILGALTGDILSYSFGKIHHHRLKKMWPFAKHPQWISTGEHFFEKHGGKSIIIGRFFGPVRSFVPLIAGFLQMHPLYFILAAIPSATLWAIVYLTPGILLGALSVELPPSLATKFILYFLLGFVGLWILTWLVKIIMQKFWGAIDHFINILWQRMRARKAWHFITTPLADPREPNLHEQLMLLLGAILAFILSLIFLWNITHHGVLTGLNQPIYHFLQSIRTPFVDKVMVLFTLLGDRKCILTFSVVILCWLSLQRQWRAAAHWLALMVLVIGSALSIKWGYYSPRPHIDMPSNSTSSLPSGHAIFTLSFFGFLAVLISHELARPLKKRSYQVVLGLVLLTGFSRIYLGAHWLTDIIASYLIGLSCLLLVTISYRRHLTLHLSPKKLALASSIILVLIWSIYSTLRFSETYQFHAIRWPKTEMAYQNWWQHSSSDIPNLRVNRFGQPAEPLNIQWRGSLDKIKEELEKQGWHYTSTELDLKGFLERLSLQDPSRRLPLISPLFQNRAPVLLMTKFNAHNHFEAILYLWPSEIQILNGQTPLWLGTLKKYKDVHQELLHSSTSAQSGTFNEEFSILLKDTQKSKTFMITVSPDNQNAIPAQWNWSGKILQLDNGSE